MLVVSGIGGIKRSGAVLGDQGGECLVDEGSVANASSYPPSPSQEMLVDCRAYPHPYHAIRMPQVWHIQDLT